MVRLLTVDDIPAWLELAREVEPLFGRMVGDAAFEEGLRRAVLEGCVYGHEGEHNTLDGVIALNRDENEIAWLAVSSGARGRGIGGLLLEGAIGAMDSKRDIIVQTFAGEIREGAPARRLYLRHGFQNMRDAGRNPAGIETIIMKRRRETTD